jgi:RNA polymerase sigma factor (TIGR02999 family)
MRPVPPSAVQLTRILRDWIGGDASALERLTPIVYPELYRLARLNMAEEREGHLLQPSALVNEAFVRLMADEPVEWQGRAHFFAHSARLMRRILIDFARAQDTGKRGGRNPHVDLSGIHDIGALKPAPVDFLDLDSALTELAELDSRQCQVVELRYFGGLENSEVATVLGISEPTVRRDWRIARAWLFSRLQPGKSES